MLEQPSAGPCDHSRVREMQQGCAILVRSPVCKSSHLQALAPTIGCGKMQQGCVGRERQAEGRGREGRERGRKGRKEGGREEGEERRGGEERRRGTQDIQNEDPTHRRVGKKSWVVSTADECTLALFCDASFAGDLRDS